MQYVFRPLVWTGPSTHPLRRRSPRTFKAGWADTIQLLDDELRWLDASNVVIAAGFREQDLRLDGLPRSGAPVPGHPGVRLLFDSQHGALSYATDTHEIWQHNVRAIALGLGALRAVDRYGISQSGEQYKGYRALPTGENFTGWTRQMAADWMILKARMTATFNSADLLKDRTKVITVYRAAARRLHPDAGGSTEDFQRLQQVRDLLEKAA